jgi:hypothetical protein
MKGSGNRKDFVCYFVRRAATGRLITLRRLVIGPQTPEIALPDDYQRVSSPVYSRTYSLACGSFRLK